MKMSAGTPWPTGSRREVAMTVTSKDGISVGDRVEITSTGEYGTVVALSAKTVRVMLNDNNKGEYGYRVTRKVSA